MAYTIYIIEDDHKIAKAIASYLQTYGYRAIIAKDFAQVIAEFLSVKPDLVILDIRLPGQDGYHLCREIRQLSHVPIFFYPLVRAIWSRFLVLRVAQMIT